MDRRKFLAKVGATGAVALAGCSSSVDRRQNEQQREAVSGAEYIESDVEIEIDDPRMDSEYNHGAGTMGVIRWSGAVQLHSDVYRSVNAVAKLKLYNVEGELARVKTKVFHQVERMPMERYTASVYFDSATGAEDIYDYEIDVKPLKAGAVKEDSA